MLWRFCSLSLTQANFACLLASIFRCVFVCSHAGLSNPPTDLVCKPTASQVQIGNSIPQIEMSWRVPIPNGGKARIYTVNWLDFGAGIYESPFKEKMEESTNCLLNLSSEDVYEVSVSVFGSDSCCATISCRVDTRDRCE